MDELLKSIFAQVSLVMKLSLKEELFAITTHTQKKANTTNMTEERGDPNLHAMICRLLKVTCVSTGRSKKIA
jgi:hypothetical protein